MPPIFVRWRRFIIHLPSYESSERLNEVLKVLERYFNIEETFKLTHGTSGDRGRTFAVCSKKSVRMD